jgi:hypothetical protein
MKQQKKNSLAQSAVDFAQKFLKEDEDNLEMLRMHEFPDDESAHDDELTERLYAEFSADVESAQAELSRHYGDPARTGTEDDELIPLNGVFRFAIWSVEGKHLFIAAHHEDRGVPIVLALGTSPE